MKKSIILVIFIAGIAAGNLMAMNYYQLPEDVKAYSVLFKQSDDDNERLPLSSQNYLALIEASIEKNPDNNDRVINLHYSNALSREQLSKMIHDLEMGLNFFIPQVYRQYAPKFQHETMKFSKYEGDSDFWYASPDKSASEILALDEDKRRTNATKYLLKLKAVDDPISWDKKGLEYFLAIYFTTLHAAETLKVPEIHENKAHSLAHMFLRSVTKDTLQHSWLKDMDVLKLVDKWLGSLTEKSNTVVLKYMNHKETTPGRNNQLPAETVKQAVYLQALALAPDDVKEQALRVPEICNALAEYKRLGNRSQINKAYPAIQKIQKEVHEEKLKIKKETEEAFLQTIKDRDKWSL
jgi:hypothetical protein